MKGLLIKELLYLKQYFRVFIGLIVFFMLIALFNHNLSAMASMIVTLPLIISINSYSADAMNRWAEFSVCFPFTRKKLVQVKYIFMLLLTVLITGLVVIIGFICHCFIAFDVSEFIINLFALFCTSLILLSILAPLIYKYGIEKSRYLLMIIVMIPFLLIILFGSYLEQPGSVLIQLTSIPPAFLISIPILLTASFFTLSCHLSAKIFEEKDL